MVTIISVCSRDSVFPNCQLQLMCSKSSFSKMPQRIICVRFMHSCISSFRIVGLVIVVQLRSTDLAPCDFLVGIHQVESVWNKALEWRTMFEECIRSICSSVAPEMLLDVGQACLKRWLGCYKEGGACVWMYH